MPKKLTKITLSDDEKKELKNISRSRKHSVDEIDRAKILLLFSDFVLLISFIHYIVP